MSQLVYCNALIRCHVLNSLQGNGDDKDFVVSESFFSLKGLVTKRQTLYCCRVFMQEISE